MSNPTLLQMPLAVNGDKNTIPVETGSNTGLFSQKYGFQSINSLPLSAGGKAISRHDYNGAMYLLSNILFYAQKGYTFEFDSTQDYFVGCEVIDPVDGNKYRCIADVAAEGGNPSKDTTHWERIFNESAFFYRMPSTTYTVGDVKYTANLPSWGFLTCIAGGVAGSGELVIPVGTKAGDTITDGQVVWRLDSLTNMKKALAEATGYGIVSGCEPSISGLTVTVGAGVVHLVDGTRKEIAETNITLDSADPSNPRVDLVYITSTGEVAKITGAAAASPVVPALPSGGISVCNVTIVAGATTGTVNRVQTIAPNLANYGIVNVKDFGAVGDGVHDDTQAIQAALNAISPTEFAKLYKNNHFIYPQGGGSVLFPAGEYRITDTLLVGTYCRLVGVSTRSFTTYALPYEKHTGATIIADFSDRNKWVIESAVYKTDGTRLGYREIINGNSAHTGKVNLCSDIEIENLAIYSEDKAYGAIRIAMAPESRIENVSINGTDVGVVVNASWGVNILGIHSQTYLYGCCALLDVNGISINGYYNKIGSKTITADNALDFQGGGAGFGLPENFNLKSAGIICNYARAVSLNNVITEHWNYGRIIVNTDTIIDNAGYIEGASEGILMVRNSKMNISGLFITSLPPRGYVVGNFTKLTIINSDDAPVVGMLNQETSVNFIGETANMGTSYIGTSGNTIYVSDSFHTGYVTYATLGHALAYISRATKRDWVIMLDAGKTYNLTTDYNITNKNIAFRKNGVGDNPKIHSVAKDGGYASMLMGLYGGDISICFDGVDLDFDNVSPRDYYERGFLEIRGGNAVNFNFSARNSNIDLKTGWCLFQAMNNSVANINVALNGSNISGAGSSALMSGVYGSNACVNVIYAAISTTISASILAIGTNGWDSGICNVVAYKNK